MSVLRRLRGWWSRDALERAEEDTRLTPGERDAAEQDYEGVKDDVSAREHLAEEGVDFERDSEPPTI